MIFTVAFADCRVCIDCRGLVAEQIVTFLFPQAVVEKLENSEFVFLLKSVSQENREALLFYKEDREIFRSDNPGVMAAMVLDAVVSWFAGECRMGPTLHAAALILDDRRGVLLPGKSGSGKSTLSAWMTHHGYGYLTDELACIPNHAQHTLLGFPRPIHLKDSMADYFGELLENSPESVDSHGIGRVLKNNRGLLVPAVHLNSKMRKKVPLKPSVKAIIYPTFQKGAVCQIELISSAQSFTHMMGIVVNARNFEDHAVKSIAQLTREVPSFALTFGQLEHVMPILASVRHEF